MDRDLTEVLSDIKSLGAHPAITLKPDTPVKNVFDFIPYVEMVLMMSVFPGFGGQKFIKDSYSRIEQLKNFIAKNNAQTLIEVDGGVSAENLGRLKSCGADVFVIGSVIFNSDDPNQTITHLKQLAR
jgi:ribulose-phosphate 3-epimerase